MDEKIKRQSWTPMEREYVLKHYEKQTVEEMADYLCKTVVAVEQFMFRNRMSFPKVKRNLVFELITCKFVDPNYFRPTRAFYHATNINQRRWWNLYLGRAQVTESEYLSICSHLKITVTEAWESRQLSIHIPSDK